MPYVTVEEEVWVDPSDILCDLKDDEIISELSARGYNTVVLEKVRSPSELAPENKAAINLERLFEMKRMNSPAFDRAFAEYVWSNLGKVL